MKKNLLNEELRRMHKLAGLLNENEDSKFLKSEEGESFKELLFQLLKKSKSIEPYFLLSHFSSSVGYPPMFVKYIKFEDLINLSFDELILKYYPYESMSYWEEYKKDINKVKEFKEGLIGKKGGFIDVSIGYAIKDKSTPYMCLISISKDNPALEGNSGKISGEIHPNYRGEYMGYNQNSVQINKSKLINLFDIDLDKNDVDDFNDTKNIDDIEFMKNANPWNIAHIDNKESMDREEEIIKKWTQPDSFVDIGEKLKKLVNNNPETIKKIFYYLDALV